MLKKVYLIVFILVMVTGCNKPSESTTLSPEEALVETTEKIEAPVFNLKGIYAGRLEISINEAITYSGELMLSIDGTEYKQEVLQLEEGVHELVASVQIGQTQSEKTTLHVTVLDENDTDNDIVYSKPSLTSDIMGTIEKDAPLNETDYSYTYEIMDSQLKSWNKVQILGDKYGYVLQEMRPIYINSEKRTIITLIMSNGEILIFDEKKDNCWYTIDEQLTSKGYYMIKVMIDGQENSTILVNSQTGKQYETFGNLDFYLTKDKFIARSQSYNPFLQMDYKMQISSIGKEGVDVEWEAEFSDYGTDEIAWIDDAHIRYTRFSVSDNDWIRADRDYIAVMEILNLVDGKWNLTTLSEEETNTGKATIYDSISREANEIGDILESEIVGAVFTNTYQIINYQLCLWFQMDLGNGKTGYLYRALKEDELMYYDNERSGAFNLILESGKVLTIEDHVKESHDYYVKDELAEVGYYTIYGTYDGEGHKGYCINGTTGEIFNTKGYPITSISQNKFMVANFDLEAGYSWNGIQIYSINQSTILLEFEFGSNEWGPSDVQWIDDQHVYFIKNYLDNNMQYTQVDAQAVFDGQQWIIEDLY